MKKLLIICTGFISAYSATAQTDKEISENARQIFYGSRIQQGAVLVTGGIGFTSETAVQNTLSMRTGIGVGVSDRVTLQLIAAFDNAPDLFPDAFEDRYMSFGGGFRLWPEAVAGGVLQLYAGVDAAWSRITNFQRLSTDGPSLSAFDVNFAEIAVPVGVTAWFSSSVGLQIEFFRLGFISELRGSDAEINRQSLRATTFQPSLSLIIAFNAKEPQD